MKRRALIATAVASVMTAAVTLAGCANSDSLGGASSSAAADTIVVGSANFTESVTLAYAYGEALKAAGVNVTYKVNIGARPAYFPALQNGEVDLIPEYAGSALSYLDAEATAKSPEDVEAALTKALPEGLQALNFAPGADSDSLNVTKEFADKNGLTSIADLKKLDSVTLAANPEFETRADGIPGLKSVYGLDSIKFSAINDGGGPATLKALLDGTVQVADIYSTTPSITANNLVTLTDPENMFASQQVVPIVNKDKANATATETINKVSALITTDVLLAWNTRTQGDEKADPETVATEWLKEQGLVK